jgi:predicted solute-binding protein
MDVPRISASSYSNTAPLVWSFLYGSNHGKVELILDNAPARSAELLAAGRVDAALVPVIAYQFIEKVKLIPTYASARGKGCAASAWSPADVT